MKQNWHDLLFAHWPVPAETMRPMVPAELQIDTFDGNAWVGVVPFWMGGIHARGLPPLPGLSRFPELNVRTYVTLDGKPGVYFFSLDAANRPAVWGARTFFYLPYFYASIKSVRDHGTIRYSCHRHLDSADFRASYRPISEARLRSKGSVEHWLTERYCLYTVRGGKVFRGDIHHLQWPLQDAAAEFEANTMAAAAGIVLPQTSPLLHFSRTLEVLIWSLRQVR